jgi:hypothetical protein
MPVFPQARQDKPALLAGSCGCHCEERNKTCPRKSRGSNLDLPAGEIALFL